MERRRAGDAARWGQPRKKKKTVRGWAVHGERKEVGRGRKELGPSRQGIFHFSKQLIPKSFLGAKTKEKNHTKCDLESVDFLEFYKIGLNQFGATKFADF